MLRASRYTAAALAGLIGFGSVVAPVAAQASEEGKRNTTYALGAAAAALLLTQKNKLPGALAAGGAIYAYSQYQNDINKRHKRERAAAYRYGYRRGASYTRYHRRSAHR
jgi:hypothetical protein